jgi:hypothetical protein
MEQLWFRRHVNSNVSKILPLTTFRTIDLGGRKNIDPVFSIFCAKLSVFFEANAAPEYVQLRDCRITTTPAMIELCHCLAEFLNLFKVMAAVHPMKLSPLTGG